MKYQCFDSGKPNGAWEVTNLRTGKVLARFYSEDEAKNKADAVRYVQQCVEDDQWNASNRD